MVAITRTFGPDTQGLYDSVLAGIQPAGPSDGPWLIAWNDEFSGSVVDTAKWSTMDGETVNAVTVYDSNVTVADGNLVLTLVDSTSGACVQSLSDFKVDQFAEASVFIPGAGNLVYNWPMWWATVLGSSDAGEIDIADGTTYQLSTSYHSPTYNPSDVIAGGPWPGSWHTYGVYRHATYNEYYWDGVLVASYPVEDTGVPYNLLLSIGESPWIGNYSPPFNQLLVEWVRVWDFVGPLDFNDYEDDDTGLTDEVVTTRPRVDDDTGLGDSLAFVLESHLVEAFALTDTVTSLKQFTTQNDALGLSDSLVRETAKADNLGLTDSVSLVMALGRSQADDLALADSTAFASVLARSQTDNLGLTHPTVVTELGVQSAQADTLGLADAVTPVLIRTRHFDDQGLSDSLAFALTANRADTLGLADTAGLSRTFTRDESFGITDVTSVALLTVQYTDFVVLIGGV